MLEKISKAAIQEWMSRPITLSKLVKLAVGLVGVFVVIMVFGNLFSSLSPWRAKTNKYLRVQDYMEGYGQPASADFAAAPASPLISRRAGRASSDAVASRGGPNIAQEVIENVDGGAIAKSALADRRIIYTATVDMVTEAMEGIEPKLQEMLKAAGGFVADTNQTGASGGQRSGTWRVRVPVDQYDGFLQKVRTLAEVQSVNVTSQDVTEEFVDVSARVAAKKVQEQRMIDLIKNAVGKLDEILKVESELARVRSEIERMEGRIRVLKDQTELTTITITVREVKDYKPPEAPTFGTKMRRAWQDSMTEFWENAGLMVLILVSWLPFLPIYLVVYGALIWLAVKIWRKIWPLFKTEFEIKAVKKEAAAPAAATPSPPTDAGTP